jgi:nitrogen regulatory protein PII
MLPSSVADAYRGYKEKLEEEQSRTPASYDNSIVEKYYTGGLDAGTDSPEGLAIAVCDAIIREFTDEQVQRLLRDLDNTDVALMMRGISGEGRKKIFTNMSDLLATMVAADMDCMGEVSLRDVYAATEKILSVIEKFIKRGDICCEEENLIETATKFIRAQAAKKPDPDELREAGLELVMVLEEYRQQRHFVFQPIRAGED